METTEYFRVHVMRKRPYLREAWLEEAARHPLNRQIQPDGRVRAWTWVEEMGKYLRVIWLADGIVVHNAFPDRRFKGGTKT